MITNDHTISYIGNDNKSYQFSDYQETSSNDIHCLAAELILKDLNKSNQSLKNDHIKSLFESGEESYGLPPKTMIIMNDNSLKDINSIEIGDTLLDGNYVEGIMVGKADKVKWFLYNGKIF